MEVLVNKLAEQFYTFIPALVLEKILFPVAVFLLFWLLGMIFYRNILKWLLHICNKTRSKWDETILIALGKPMKTFIILIGLYLSLDIILNTPFQEQLLLKFFRSSLVAVLGWALYRLSDNTSALSQEVREKWNVDSILVTFLSKFLHFLIIALVIIIIAGEWGFDVNGFIAGLGLGGLALALAAKDMLANFFGGIVIILEKPFSIGDWISIPGTEGTIENISFRSTGIRTFDQSLVTVPNSILATQAITNYSRRGKRRISFSLGISYQTSKAQIESVVKHIKHLLIGHPAVHQETIMVNFESFGESNLNIFLYFFTTTTIWSEHLLIKEELNLRIKDILEEESVEIAYPSRDLYLRRADETE